ncbi:MAG: hypothetical protein K2Y21_05710 [Phycisphaerales bacterium]|nr:hypothetical protein [Phycisphaerales bacterium]
MIAPFAWRPVQRIEIGDASASAAELVGFTSDGHEALVVSHGVIPEQPRLDVSQRLRSVNVPVRLLGVHLTTHKVREIAAIEVSVHALGWTSPAVAAAADGLGAGGGDAWAMVHTAEIGSTTLYRSDAEPRRVENPPVTVQGSTQGLVFTLEHGRFVMRRETSMDGWPVMAIDRDGVATALPPRIAQADISYTRDRGFRLLNHGPPLVLDALRTGWVLHSHNTSRRERWLYVTSWNGDPNAPMGEIRLWKTRFLDGALR